MLFLARSSVGALPSDIDGAVVVEPHKETCSDGEYRDQSLRKAVGYI